VARRSVDSPKLGEPAREITPGLERTEISDPYVIFTIDCHTPGMVDAAAVKPTGVTELRAVRSKRIDEAISL
jgi:hypothetical protein